MTTITQKEDDIFVIRAPGKREGDIIEVSDMEDNVVRARLTMPMGDQFGFVWADPVQPPTEEDSADEY